ncbi:hypothetical protein KUW17_17655 [Leisingera aquaemixtae]|uniref:hypothetical protein n=1 Tax=Leisingera TaxID=191028 RepID=UPI001C9632DF|nr:MULTISPECIES: hypothetical protein [Leisingera]MBY6068575.1 hypothetical protein [Leisingera aquaemixtae]MCB4457531.1 hypothetical protein [Leisingera sp. McT4-56]
MNTYVPKAVQEALDTARLQGMRRKSRLRVMADNELYPVLRLWKTGFSVEAETAPMLRGLVDIYDGARHVSQCLIVAGEEEGGEMRYEFKRSTPAADKAPLDFYKSPDGPAGLIPFDQSQGKI